MASRDGGRTFSHVGSRLPFLRPSADGTRGSRRVRVLPSPVVVGDYWYIYVWMTNFAEDANLTIDPTSRFPGDGSASAIGLVKFRQE